MVTTAILELTFKDPHFVGTFLKTDLRFYNDHLVLQQHFHKWGSRKPNYTNEVGYLFQSQTPHTISRYQY